MRNKYIRKPVSPFCRYVSIDDNYYECEFCNTKILKTFAHSKQLPTCPVAFRFLGLTGNFMNFVSVKPFDAKTHWNVDIQAFLRESKKREAEEKEKELKEFLQDVADKSSELVSQKPKPEPTTPIGGPGTELKALLKLIGITSSPNCKCNARARLMDEWGCDICEGKIHEIVGWLKEEAENRKLPFMESAARILVKRAIKNARKKQSKLSP